MIAIKGHYNGNVVVLDEPAPVTKPVEVVVEFPDERKEEAFPARKYRWEEARAILGPIESSVSEELIRQRREE